MHLLHMDPMKLQPQLYRCHLHCYHYIDGGDIMTVVDFEKFVVASGLVLIQKFRFHSVAVVHMHYLLYFRYYFFSVVVHAGRLRVRHAQILKQQAGVQWHLLY